MAGTFDPELPNGFQDADFEMRELEAAGRVAYRGFKAMRRLRAEGKLAEAAKCCSHGAGYPTNSPAAENDGDPRSGQRGYRCSDCGSFFAGVDDLWRLRVKPEATAPCEWTRTR